MLARARVEHQPFREITYRLVGVLAGYQHNKCFLSGLPLASDPEPTLVKVQQDVDWRPGNVIIVAGCWAPVYRAYGGLVNFRTNIRVQGSGSLMVPTTVQLLRLLDDPV
jgi:hypothetical protein